VGAAITFFVAVKVAVAFTNWFAGMVDICFLARWLDSWRSGVAQGVRMVVLCLVKRGSKRAQVIIDIVWEQAEYLVGKAFLNTDQDTTLTMGITVLITDSHTPWQTCVIESVNGRCSQLTLVFSSWIKPYNCSEPLVTLLLLLQSNRSFKNYVMPKSRRQDEEFKCLQRLLFQTSFAEAWLPYTMQQSPEKQNSLKPILSTFRQPLTHQNCMSSCTATKVHGPLLLSVFSSPNIQSRWVGFSQGVVAHADYSPTLRNWQSHSFGFPTFDPMSIC
jgi:hypothetical protein